MTLNLNPSLKGLVLWLILWVGPGLFAQSIDYQYLSTVPSDGTAIKKVGAAIMGNDGQIYLVDTRDNAVVVLDSLGQKIKEIRQVTTSTGIVRLVKPIDIALSPDGDLHIADAGLAKVIIHRSSGSGSTAGQAGGKLGQIEGLTGVNVDQGGYISVINNRREQIDLLTPEGEHLTWQGGALGNILAADIDQADQLHLLTESAQILVWDHLRSQVLETVELRKIAGLQNIDPIDLAVTGTGSIFVVDKNSNRVVHLSTERTLLGKIGADGKSSPGVFEQIECIAWNESRSQLIIADGKSQSVQVFALPAINEEGKAIDRRMQITRLTETSSVPWDVSAVDPELLYSIPADDRTKVLAHRDQEVVPINHTFQRATSLATTTDGRLYVLDQKAKEILLFGPNGSLIQSFGGEIDLKRPTSIALFNNGDLLVTDVGKGNVHRWSAEGVYRKLLIKAYASPILAPLQVEIDEEDNIFILDEEKNAIYRFDEQGTANFSTKCRARPEKPGEKPGKITSFFLDPFGQINLYNADNAQIETYEWKDTDPRLIFSFGNPTYGDYMMPGIDKLSFDPYLYRCYCVADKSRERMAFQYSITPPTPDGDLDFRVENGTLLVGIKPVDSRAVASYALLAYFADKGPEVRYTTSGNEFPVKEEGVFPTPTLITYELVSQSYTANSRPAARFKNYFGMATQCFEARMYEESLDYFDLALDSITDEIGMRRFVSSRYADIGRGYVASGTRTEPGVAHLIRALEIDPSNTVATTDLKHGYVSQYLASARNDDIKGIIDHAARLREKNSKLSNIALEAMDSVAKNLSKESTSVPLNQALSLYRQLMKWSVSTPDLAQSLGSSLYQVYLLKKSGGATSVELDVLLGEAEIYLSRAVRDLRQSNAPYQKENLQYIDVLNRLGKASQAELLAIEELTRNIAALTAEEHIRYRMALGRAYQLQQKHNLAVSEYQNVLSLAPNNAQVKLDLAEVLVDSKKFEQAKLIYRQLSLESPNDPVIIEKLAYTELLQGNFAESTFQFEKALQMNPDNQSIYGSIASAYFGASNYGKAKEFYTKAIGHQRKKIADEMSGRGGRHLSRYRKTLADYLSQMGSIHEQTGAFSDAVAAFEEATELDATNAAAWYGLGTTSLSTGQVYNAVKALNKAMKLDPGNDLYANANFNALNLREEMSKNRDPLSISEVALRDIFPSFYLTYAEPGRLPVGKAVISNHTGIPLFPTSLSLSIPGLVKEATMQPSTSFIGFSNNDVQLHLQLEDDVMDITEAKRFQGKLTLKYRHREKSYSTTENFSVMVHGRNAISWTDKKKLGAFISRSTPSLLNYTREIQRLFNQVANSNIPTTIDRALQLYTSLSTSGYVYNPDPQTNFANASTNPEIVDYLQYPVETIQRKTGDCDDFVVLFSSLLEHAGIASAYIDLPGHVMLAFDAQLTVDEALLAGLTTDDIIEYQGHAWIPLETTLLSEAGFMQAWNTAIDRYNLEKSKGNFPELIPISTSQEIYIPVSYSNNSEPALPSNASMVLKQYQSESKELENHLSKRSSDFLRDQFISQPENTHIGNKYARALAENGDFERAREILQGYLNTDPYNTTILNNLGNIFYLEEDYEQAIALYKETIKHDPEDAHVLVNIARSFIEKGDQQSAREWYQKALKTNTQIHNFYPHLKFLSQ